MTRAEQIAALDRLSIAAEQMAEVARELGKVIGPGIPASICYGIAARMVEVQNGTIDVGNMLLAMPGRIDI